MEGADVDDVVFCDIPIGKDDARGSAVWVLHRGWLCQRKIVSMEIMEAENQIII